MQQPQRHRRSPVGRVAYLLFVLAYLATAALHGLEHRLRASASILGAWQAQLDQTHVVEGHRAPPVTSQSVRAPLPAGDDDDCETCRTLAFAGVALLALGLATRSRAVPPLAGVEALRPTMRLVPVATRLFTSISARGPPLAA